LHGHLFFVSYAVVFQVTTYQSQDQAGGKVAANPLQGVFIIPGIINSPCPEE
jgi:hypothetical protein